MAQIDIKKCTVKFVDGSGSPKTLTLKVDEGTLDYTEKRPIVYTKDRGLLSGVREGDQEPMEVKLDLIWEFIKASTGSGTPTPEDVLKNRGEAASWVTTDADPCNPYAIDIVIYDVPNCSPTQNETITLTDFRYEDIQHNLKEGKLSVTGKCNVTQATPVRS